MKIINKIKQKYYTYIPGEFFPIYTGNELINKRAFHAYKFKRALWKVKNYKLVIYHMTHKNSYNANWNS